MVMRRIIFSASVPVMGKDAEIVLDDIQTFLKANLNTQIGVINTDKGDFTLDTVANEAYFFQTMNNRVSNFNPFVYFAVVDSAAVTDREGGHLGVNYEFVVFVVSVDNSNDATFERRMLRYGKALMQLFVEKWDKISKPDKFEVSNVEPFPFKLQAGGSIYKAAGVNVKLAIVE